MPSKSPAQRLQDIIQNIDAIQQFLETFDYHGFVSDRRTVYAVVRALEIISEASPRLPSDLKARHPEIDWTAVAASGNVYRHEYETVDKSLIWHTARDDLEQLRRTAIAELKMLTPPS